MLGFYKMIGDQLIQLDQPESGCWINIYPPFTADSLRELSTDLGVPFDFLMDSLDVDEKSRYESEDGIDLVVVNTPIENDGINETGALFSTIPIGIISTPDYIITISSFENPVIDSFLEGKIKNFDPQDQSGFVLHIFNETVKLFLTSLKTLNNMRYQYEKELYHSSRNKELNNLLNIQKSLVYFVTNLKSNEMMMMKIHRTDFLRLEGDEEKIDFLSDIIVDNSQAREMSDVHTNILSTTMDTFASIISNNLNTILKRLTSVTIILMVPTLVASFYGMNMKLPLVNDNSDPVAFLFVMLISIVLSVSVIWIFLRNRWF